MRRLLADWAAGEGLDEDTVDAIVLSGYEAMANTVEHAYREAGAGLVDVFADHADHVVTVTIADRGRWRTPPADPGGRGRGLVLIHGLGTEARVASSAAGTTVTMTWDLDGE